MKILEHFALEVLSNILVYALNLRFTQRSSCQIRINMLNSIKFLFIGDSALMLKQWNHWSRLP
jgi:hypothetical protein